MKKLFSKPFSQAFEPNPSNLNGLYFPTKHRPSMLSTILLVFCLLSPQCLCIVLPGYGVGVGSFGNVGANGAYGAGGFNGYGQGNYGNNYGNSYSNSYGNSYGNSFGNSNGLNAGGYNGFNGYGGAGFGSGGGGFGGIGGVGLI